MKMSMLQLNRKKRPIFCAIQIKSGESVVTVGHMPGEIPWHCYFFLEEEGGWLMVMCLVQLIHLHPFHQAVWNFFCFYDFKVRSMSHIVKWKRSYKHYTTRGILVLRLMLAMKNLRRKSVFQLKKGNISEK